WAAAVASSQLFLLYDTACCDRASAPFWAAAADSTTASRFFLPWAFSSLSEATDLSTPSRNALAPAAWIDSAWALALAVVCSTVFFTVSAASAMGSLLKRKGSCDGRTHRYNGTMVHLRRDFK